MQPTEMIALTIFGIIMICVIIGMFALVKSMMRNKKIELRKDMVLELLKEHPNMSKDEILNLVDETIK